MDVPLGSSADVCYFGIRLLDTTEFHGYGSLRQGLGWKLSGIDHHWCASYLIELSPSIDHLHSLWSSDQRVLYNLS